MIENDYYKISFFHQKDILEGEQIEWYRSYLQRPNDQMFIVNVNEKKIGCMGIRAVDNHWDVYNIILGDRRYSKQGFMSKAFQLMLIGALDQNIKPIRLTVLKQNPAITWYKKNKFNIVGQIDNSFIMEYQT